MRIFQGTNNNDYFYCNSHTIIFSWYISTGILKYNIFELFENVIRIIKYILIKYRVVKVIII